MATGPACLLFAKRVRAVYLIFLYRSFPFLFPFFFCREKVYCPFPGYIANGKVMLMGNMGYYDYRPYVKKVTNNRQIMYECDRGFKLDDDGPPGATCVAGRWSPKQLPRCVAEQHSRGRWARSIKPGRAGPIAVRGGKKGGSKTTRRKQRGRGSDVDYDDFHGAVKLSPAQSSTT